MSLSAALHAMPGWQGAKLALARAGWIVALLGLSTSLSQAQTSPGAQKIPVEIFLRTDSDQCQRARVFLEKLAKERTGLDLRIHDVVQDQAALRRVWELSRRHKLETAGLPTIYVCDRLRVGFQDDQTTGRAIEELLTLHAFLRQGCPKCARAKAYLGTFHRRWPAIRIVEHDVIQDSGAQTRLYELARQHQVVTPVVPAFHLGGRFIVGFRGEVMTGRELEAAIQNSVPPLPVQTKPPSSSKGDESTGPAEPSPSQERTNATRRSSAIDRDQTTSPLNRNPAPLYVEHRDSHCFPTGLLSVAVVARGPPTYSRQTLVALGMFLLLAAVGDEAPPDPLPLPVNADNSPDTLPPLPEELPAIPDEAGVDWTADHDAPSNDFRETIELPIFGPVNVHELGMPAFTFLIGLVDGFNPCAMWVLVFLLSILVNIKDRRKILAIAGSFVLVSGLAYFAFMAAWLNVFQLIGLQRKVQILLGVLGITIGIINIKDFFAFRQGITLSIPESAKPGLYRRVREIVTTKYLSIAITGAVTLAVVVNVIELFCTAGLPAMYTQVLTMQQLPAWANYGYLALYNVAYMLDDTILLVIAVITLSHRKLQEREGRWLKLLSGLVILALGLAMILRPDWLGYSA